jgi:hypothetical protein
MPNSKTLTSNLSFFKCVFKNREKNQEETGKIYLSQLQLFVNSGIRNMC